MLKAMKNLTANFFQGRLQVVLITFFSFIVILTVGLSTIVIQNVINDYLVEAESNQVDRDMKLAQAFYQDKLEQVVSISNWLTAETNFEQTTSNANGNSVTECLLDDQITKTIAALDLADSHLVAVLDANGNILVGRTFSSDGNLSPVIQFASWKDLHVVASALESGLPQAATEVIPDNLLEYVGLSEQMQIALVDTPLEAPELFDPREGTAGLAVISVVPVFTPDGAVAGATLAAYFFNNDTALVDRVKEIAGVDTVTLFLGDLRVSTNVMTAEGTRAIGTRISEEVYDVVLRKGETYVGRAYVVDEWFITRYEPLRNHEGKVVGSLYVGARESAFIALVERFRNLVLLIAVFSIGLAAMLAVPIARFITRPVDRLVEAHRILATGDMTVRVEPHGTGELAELGKSFNSMATTMEQAQQELLRKETLASIGQLAAGVAHEINNPLGTILLFSEMLQKDLAADTAHRNDLKMIVQETVRCKRIVSGLLNFARQQDILAQDTDLHELLDQVVALASRQPEFRLIEIKREYASQLPPIQADPFQLQQVFTNLLNNGAQAIQGSGEITIITAQVDANSVSVSIRDTGIGIAPENLQKLYTPFFTTKTTGKGTGLGLAIVYGIIKMHRGQISVESEVGKGTTFTILLPIRNMNHGGTVPQGPDVIG